SAAQRATWAAGNKRYWLLPSENEWYKAAYYKGGGTNSGYWLYPTQSDNTPTWELSTSTGPNPGANSGNFRDKTHGYSVTGSTSNDPSQDYLTDVGAYPNSLSAYGTLDQGGELWQWNDQFYSTSLRCVRGGYWGDISGLLASSFRGICESTTEGNDIGFRVASVGVPEPNSVALVVVGGLSLLGYAWRRRMPHSRRPAILAAVAFVGLASCPVLAATYVAIDLSPSGFAESEGYGACGTQQVGYGQTTKNSGTTHALLWSGTANSVVDLTLSGFTQSYAWATNGMQQVGNGYGSATAGNTHAILWSGTAASAVDLNPTGFDGSLAYGISGTQQVGQGYGTATGGDHHALLWNGTANSAVDINPSGFSYSYAWATVGTQQVGQGYGPVTGGKYHALVWGGNAASAVDLNPAGFNLTVAFATNGSQQVGDGYGTPTGGNYHALLWSGTASSAVDLNPSGFSMSGATGISDTQEVGYGYGTATGGNYHALLWNGTAASAVDLSQFLPAGFVESYAKGIDAQGNIIGYAVDASGNDHAILWKPVPEPSTLALFGVGALGLLRFSWRRRRGRARCLS
ncbi:MAG: PEP-CTERM sorting domain-containing protein, partial [Thermoguttaceae bacterium]